MRSNVRTLGTSAALALTLLAGLGRAEDAKAGPTPEQIAAALAEAGQPAPEHAKLQPLAGTWSYTCTCLMDPSHPVVTKGTVERQWILGGRFLEERISGEGFPGGPAFEGRGLLGYDKGLGQYTSSFACTMSTGACSGAGEFDAAGKELTLQTEAFCPVFQKVVQGRDVIRIESPDRVVMESYFSADGKETKKMEIVAVRKK